MEETTGFMDWLSQLVKDFSFANFIPELDTVLGWVAFLCKLAVMVGPLVLLVFGLLFWFCPASEANHRYGYRFWWGMSSVEAWQFTQRVAGMLWTAIGLPLSLIMLLMCGGFAPETAPDMVSTASTCLIWELVIVALVCLSIDVLVILRFDRKGVKRQRILFTVPDKLLAFPKKRKKKAKPQKPQMQ